VSAVVAVSPRAPAARQLGRPAALRYFRAGTGDARQVLPTAHATTRLPNACGATQGRRSGALGAEGVPDLETLILDRCAGEIASAAGRGAAVVEFGSGASAKTACLLAALDAPKAYRAIDRSAASLAAHAAALRARFPSLPVDRVRADFTGPAAAWSAHESAGQCLLAFLPDSRIGRFAADAARDFLRRLALWAGRDALLVIGADAGCGPHALESRPPRSCPPDRRASIHDPGRRAYCLPQFEALARATGWQHAQFWADGQGRFGVHVLAPS